MKKKNIVIIVAIVISSILLLFFGLRTSKSSGPFDEAFAKARSAKEKMNERVEIKASEDNKYKSLVVLQTGTNKQNFGTGFIVGKNKILTNVHVTDDFSNNRDTLTALLRTENDELIDFKVKSVVNAPNDVDLSIVEVEPTADGKNISDNIELLKFADLEEIKQVKLDDIVQVVGYPIDKPYGTLWHSEGKLLLLQPNLVAFDAYTQGGNSGSPILNKDGKIIGLLNSGTDSSSNPDSDSNKNLSIGFLLNEDLFNFIKSNI